MKDIFEKDWLYILMPDQSLIVCPKPEQLKNWRDVQIFPRSPMMDGLYFDPYPVDLMPKSQDIDVVLHSTSKGIVCLDNIDIYRRNKQYIDARIREYAEGLV